MKPFIFISIFILVIRAPKILSQTENCNTKELSQASISKIPEGFNFLKNYDIYNEEGNREKIEYSYVLTKGTTYVITISTKGPDESIIVNILDSGRTKMASNKINGQIVSSLMFTCGATGIYYIQYAFNDKLPHCAGSSLGFKR